MRIAQVVLSLNIGGQERLIVRLAAGLRALGHDVHIVTLKPGGALRDQVGDTPVHEMAFRGADMAAFGFDPTLYPRLWRLFRERRFEVVHTHNGPPLVYAAPAGRAAGARVVHTKHGNARIVGRGRVIARAAARFPHSFVAVSNDTAEAARRNERPPERRLSVVENGIPLGSFTPDPAARAKVRHELGIADDALVVGTVGRLVSEKDYPLLVRTMAPLVSERVRLVIVGEGPARADVEAAIAPAHRPFVTLTGARRDVPQLLASFDVFAMSSRTEGLPLALAEAMSTGLPIVATAVGGIPSVLPPEAGLLVPHGDPEPLRAALRRVMGDAATRRAMSSAARSYALGRFSEERMIEDYLALYR
jgi:glycosyltransferase involved in cell wall biosynthesis